MVLEHAVLDSSQLRQLVAGVFGSEPAKLQSELSLPPSPTVGTPLPPQRGGTEVHARDSDTSRERLTPRLRSKGVSEIVVKRAADGDPEAQFGLAMVLLSDPSQAASAQRWLEQAAEAGHARALFTLGVKLWNGEWDKGGGKKSVHRGYLLVLASAEKKYPPGLLRIGLAHVQGKLPNADREHGIRQIKAAAASGSAEAKYELAVLLHKEHGSKDPEMLKLLRDAAALDHKRAKALVEHLTKK